MNTNGKIILKGVVSMLQNRLYYAQPNCKDFTANILKQTKDEEDKTYIILNQTAFYPTGGGQPHDTGTINGVKVTDVVEVDNEIRHYMATPLESTGEVHCVIDWERRFDHMQQHAGQHILSAAFVELLNLETVSFHLGKSLVSIDLDASDISNEQLQAVENLANNIILENRPIDVKWVTENELSAYPLRKEIQATGEIRLVIIPDFDYNGCGGTHPESTGQVNGLKILSVEKHRGQTRVHFVCGRRILQQLHDKTAVVKEASRLLSAPEEEIGQAIEKLLANNHTLEKSIKEKDELLLQCEAQELIQAQQDSVIAVNFENCSIQQLQKLARLIAAESNDLTVLLAAENDDKLQFVAAKGSLVDASMKTISTAILPKINGKGGGSDAFVQGGGELTMSAENLIEMMKATLKS